MSARLVDYWCKIYREQHGIGCLFDKRDGVILTRVLKSEPNKKCVAWCIREYHRKEWEWKAIPESGFSVRLFSDRFAGLRMEYWKAKGGKAEEEQRENTQQLELISRGPKVVSIVERILAKQGGRGGTV